jgi:CheY-like chemotaxis protein/HPt (histidine-containing phosphotransfer) domain-containing protein
MADDEDKNESLVQSPRRTARILLVGDAEANREIANVLVSAGHSVDLARDGTDAVGAIGSSGYDLVLLEVQVPGTDAIGAARRIRELPAPEREIPIIAMTPDGKPDQVAEFRAAGMNDHINKPFDAYQLPALIERWLPDLASGGALHGPLPGELSARALDPQVYDELVAILGPDKIAGLMSKLEDQLARSFAAVPNTIEPLELAREAHTLVSQAGMLGFLELAELCRDLEAACLSGDDVSPLLNSARSARDRAVREIGRLRHAPRQSAA